MTPGETRTRVCAAGAVNVQDLRFGGGGEPAIAVASHFISALTLKSHTDVRSCTQTHSLPPCAPLFPQAATPCRLFISCSYSWNGCVLGAWENRKALPTRLEERSCTLSILWW